MERAKRVAVLVAEGALGRVTWPASIDVETYDSTIRGAQRAAERVKRGTVDAVIVANRAPNSDIVRAIPKSDRCSVFTWTRSLKELAREMPNLLGVQPPLDAKVLALPVKRPFVTVAHASKHPDRRPRFSDEERTALLLAFEDSIDYSKFIEGYLQLTQDLDVPVRSQSELRAELDRLRRSEPAVEDYSHVFALLWGVLTVFAVWASARLASVEAANRRAHASRISVVLDEVADAVNSARARVNRP